MTFTSLFSFKIRRTMRMRKIFQLYADAIKEKIDAIVDETFMEMFGWEDVDKWSNHKDKLTQILCDAVCTNFPS